MSSNRTIAALTLTGALAAAAVAAAGITTATAGSAGVPGSSAGVVDPARFQHSAANSFFPLNPGHVTVLDGESDGEKFREVVTVSSRTKTITGVETTVVDDVARRPDGSVSEKTQDWYATDDTGQVWYFGEDTATYDASGHVVSREGSWEAGVDGAVAGIIMPSEPAISNAFRQEFLRGSAEEQAWIVQHKKHVDTRGGRYDDILRMFEWTRLEPGVMSMKFYAKGIGIVEERDIAGGDEHFWLVSHHG
jgi:hypothetical protein